MSYRVDALPQFEADIRRASRWLAAEIGPMTAENFERALKTRLKRLEDFPHTGRHDPMVPGHLFVRFRQYHAFYRVEDESRRVVFVRLWPAARGTPPILE